MKPIWVRAPPIQFLLRMLLALACVFSASAMPSAAAPPDFGCTAAGSVDGVLPVGSAAQQEATHNFDADAVEAMCEAIFDEIFAAAPPSGDIDAVHASGDANNLQLVPSEPRRCSWLSTRFCTSNADVAAGLRCSTCTLVLGKRKNYYKCGGCNRVVCSRTCANVDFGPCGSRAGAPAGGGAQPTQRQVDAADTPLAAIADGDPRVAAPGAAELSIDELLRFATRMPAARTVKYVRSAHRRRATPLMLNALWAHAEAHAEWHKQPSIAAAGAEQLASAWAWLMPTLLFRSPIRPAGAGAPSRRELGEAIEQRLIQAEVGNWTGLLKEYLEEHVGQQLEQLNDPQWRDVPTANAQFAKASSKLDSGSLRQAKNALAAGGRASASPEIVAEVEKLVAAETPWTEQTAVQAECQAVAKACQALPPGPPTELIKRLVRGLSQGAEPGPSGWRNADISAVCRAEWGPQTLRAWTRMWHGVVRQYSQPSSGEQLWSPH